VKQDLLKIASILLIIAMINHKLSYDIYQDVKDNMVILMAIILPYAASALYINIYLLLNDDNQEITLQWKKTI